MIHTIIGVILDIVCALGGIFIVALGIASVRAMAIGKVDHSEKVVGVGICSVAVILGAILTGVGVLSLAGVQI